MQPFAYGTCTQCPIGYQCPNTKGDKVECVTATYSAAGAVTCTQCQAGFICTSADPSSRSQCPIGKYSPILSVSCTTCPNGFTCTTVGLSSPSLCSAGTYSASNSLSCIACEQSFACPSGHSANKYTCATGRVSGGSATICQLIADNSYCTTGKLSDVVTCGAGQYLVGNSCVNSVAGYYYVNAYIVPPACPQGWYSAAGDTKCTMCTAGSVCPNTDGTGIYACSLGTYSESATYTGCTDCPIGRYCTETDRPLLRECNVGYYAPNIRMTSCLICPINRECMDKKTANPCPTHYYSLAGWGVCRPCPAGQTCTVSPPQDCGLGYYSQEGDRNCHQCPLGHYCPTNRNSLPTPCLPGTAVNSLAQSACNNCLPGQFSTRGATVCTPCPAGHYCPYLERAPIVCPLGQYSNAGATACSSCNAGYVCLPGSTTPTPANQLCPKGFYCLYAVVDSKTILQLVPCPAGKYGTAAGAPSLATGCSNCPLGNYCPLQGMTQPVPCPKGSVCATLGLANRVNCPGGTYNPQVGMSLNADCLQCPTGNYCPVGSAEPITCPSGYYCAAGSDNYTTGCPAGTYNEMSAIGAGGDCMICPMGAFCAASSGQPTYCPPGTYNEFTGKTTNASCLSCDAGSACPKYGNIKPNSGVLCPPGYYCPAGTAYPTQFPCPEGTYSDLYQRTVDTDCLKCPKGYACSNATNRYNNQMIKCAPGHYCPEGTSNITQNPCPGGYYQPFSGAEDITACDVYKCPPGSYCPPGSTEPAGPCIDGFYCPEGSSLNSSLPCPAGTYSTGVGLKDVGECTKCPMGYFCAENSTADKIEKCPNGTYNPGYGKQTVADCLNCSEGYYCPINGSIAMTECGLGYYSGPAANVCIICPSGCYCNTSTTTMTDMNLGTQKCEAGFLCPTGVGEYPLESLRCEAGAYCLENSVYPITCPPGTYNPKKGGKSIIDCIPVPAGYFAGRGAIAPEGDCAPGYYCPLGSTRAKMVPCPEKTFRSKTNGQTLDDCGPCPAGYYCVLATFEPMPCPIGYYCGGSTSVPDKCPIGYFGGSPMLRNLNQCTECWSGRYCSQAALTIPDGRCDPGYYCITRAIVPNPTDGITGALCPKGGVCPQGSVTAQPCLPGTYSTAAGLTSTASCTTCPASYYCIGEVRDGVSGTCKAGYYCPAGSATERQNAAAPGYYTLAGAGVQTACGAGSYSANYASTSCSKCPAGYYCTSSTNQGVFTDCPAGYYCPEGSYTYGYTPCPAGTYNPITNLRASDECVPCTTGYYCPSGAHTAPYYVCAAGYYCDYGSTTNAKHYCPVGHYCPAGSGISLPCPAGKYNPNNYQYDPSQCYDCPAGHYCEKSGLSGPTGQCDEGYYCSGGDKVPRPDGKFCDVGQYCPKGSSGVTACPAGSYQDSVKQGSCMACPKGFFCPAGSVSFDSGQDCVAGYYCPAGTQYGTQYPCPAGTYNPNANAFSSSQCIGCDPGYYCTGTARTAVNTALKCAAGYYCLGGAATSSPTDGTTGYVCPTGSYCPLGSAYPTKCPPGSYCNGAGLAAPTASCAQGYYCALGTAAITATIRCPAGYYCPTGSSEPTPCPAGTYRSSIGAYHISHCLDCSAGYYCGTATVSPTTQCTAGFYCTKTGTMLYGHSTATPSDNICPQGYRCPAGTTNKVICANPYYQDQQGQAVCKVCPTGYECTNAVKSLCKPGNEKPSFYCPGVSTRLRVACGDGKYSVRVGANSLADCLSCPPGYYCPLTPSATEIKINVCLPGRYCPAGSGSNQGVQCPIGYYCPEGSAAPYECSPGSYCASAGLATVSGPCNAGYYCKRLASVPTQNDGTYGVLCPAGNYCPAGTPEPVACPPGTYRSTNSGQNVNDCTPCPNGKYCQTRGRTSIGVSCLAGYYCPAGTSSSSQYPCEAGHYCPPSSAAQLLCPDNTYQPLPLQASCVACPARYYCKNTNAADAQWPKICPPGKYCAGTALPVDCPTGTFNPREGMMTSTECDKCLPGKMCTTTGLAAATMNCTAGYYCKGGAKGTPDPADSTGEPCPVGHYCPSGSTYEVPCPPGTVNDLTKSVSNAACLPCPIAHYCPLRGGYSALYGASYLCAAGYLCISGASSPTPTDGTTGRKCAIGTYCGAGATAETPCLKGTYNPYEGQSSCLPCPAGRLCATNGLSAYANCPMGGYCPQGSWQMTDCPSGTYNPNINLADGSECYRCDPGKYCTGGSSAVTGECLDGYVCPRGSKYNYSAALTFSYVTLTEGLCPPGSYCLAGSKAPKECEPGTYQDEKGKTVCKSCPANYYCPVSGMSDPTLYPCAGGYICLGGASTPTPLDLTEGGRPCSTGHYCILQGGFTVELPCPAGTYEPRGGSPQCQTCVPGYYCTVGATEPTQCPILSYCPAGSATPILCPDGTYSNVQGLQDVSQCRPCPSGLYCTGGQKKASCYPGYYCESGASSPNAISTLCPAGSYCLEGCTTPTVCPIGKVRLALGGKQESDCDLCGVGYYCLSGVPTPFACPKGYYCPLQTPAPIACGKGYYQDQTSKTLPSDCQLCPAGYYCNEEGIGDLSTVRCPPGHFCNVSSAAPNDCPQGTFLNVSGGIFESDCLVCPEGFYCKEATTTPTICSEGKYCPAASSKQTACPASYYCRYTIYNGRSISKRQPCPGGYYCPKNTIDPIKCVNGYYCPPLSTSPTPCPSGTTGRNNDDNSDVTSGCTYCQAGTYSESIKANETVCQPCTAGYVCLAGATTAYPVNATSDNGYECPKGYYCPEGTYEPYACPVGTFNNKIKGNTSASCMACEVGTYNDMQGQTGCRTCGPSSTSERGALTCTCVGKNRVFHVSTGKCICQQFYTSVLYDDTEDSKKDCRPIVMDRCSSGYLRDPYGNCVSPDDCSKECKGGSGKRTAGIGICECNKIKDTESVCNATCRASAFALTVTQDGKVKIRSSVYNGTISIKSSTTILGEPKCPEGGCKMAAITMNPEGGFAADYNPSGTLLAGVINNARLLAIGQERRRRFLTGEEESTWTSIANPAMCISLGDTVTFDILNSTHYPVYCKDAMANSNPSFDYSAFTLLAIKIKNGEAPELFIFTFNQAGVYVFSDSADPSQLTVIAVMSATESCPDSDQYIVPITGASLVRMGVQQREEITLAPNWIFIGFAFAVILILVPGVVVCISYFYNSGKKQQRSLASIGFAKQTAQQPPLSTDRKSLLRSSNLDVSEDPLNKTSNKSLLTMQKDEEAEVDPGIFEEIYQQLKDHTRYVREEFRKKAVLDNQNISKVWEYMRELKHDIKVKLMGIAKIFGKNVKYLLSKKKKPEESKEAKVTEIVEQKAEDKKESERENMEETVHEEDMEQIVDTIQAKNTDDMKELARIQEQEDIRLKEFMQTYVEDQSRKLETFKERVLENANIPEDDKQGLVRQYEMQLRDLQKELLINQSEQQQHLRIRLEGRRNGRGQLAAQLDKLHTQRKDLVRIVEGQIASLDERLQRDEKTVVDAALEQRRRVEIDVETRKAQALEKHRHNFGRRLKKVSDSRKRAELLEQLEKDTQEIEQLFEKEKEQEVKGSLEQLERRVQLERSALNSQAENDKAALREHIKVQLEQMKDLELIILNKLGNVAIDEKITEAVETDKARARTEETKYEAAKDEYTRKLQAVSESEKEKLGKIREDFGKDEDLLKEDYDVQKRIITNAIKKKCEDIQRQKERLQKQLKTVLLTSEDEESLKSQIKALDDQVAKRIEGEVMKEYQKFQQKLGEKKKLRAQREADLKETNGTAKMALDKAWAEQDLSMRTYMRKARLAGIIEELKKRTKNEELPIAVENVVETIQMEELSDLLGKQCREKAHSLSEKVGELIRSKLAEMHKVKEEMETHFQRLKDSFEKAQISSSDYERRLRDIQSRENDRMRDIELSYIQRQNDMERELCGVLALQQEQELIQLREQQWNEKRSIIEEISLSSPRSAQANIKNIVGGGDIEKGIKEMEEYKEQLRTMREKKMLELDERRMRLQNIAIENEDAIKRFNEGTKKMLDQLSQRERTREENRKVEIERRKKEQEDKLKLQEGITQEEKERVLAEYETDLENLSLQLAMEQKRQASKMMEKLEKRLKEKDELKAQKQIQLATYKREVSQRVEQQLRDSRIALDNKFEVKDAKSRVAELVEKYDAQKCIFDKKKRLEGVENIEELARIQNMDQLREKAPEEEIGGILANIDFDGLYDKMKGMEDRVGNFTADQFYKLVEGFRTINTTLNELKERALSKGKKYEF